MSSDIYYGAGKIPEGKRRPTMIEAVANGQVRYYGQKKVDPTLLISRIEKTGGQDKVKHYRTLIIATNAKIGEVQKAFRKEEDQTKRLILRDEYIKLRAELVQYTNLYNEALKTGGKTKASYKIVPKTGPKKKGRPKGEPKEVKPKEKKPRVPRPKKLKPSEVSEKKKIEEIKPEIKKEIKSEKTDIIEKLKPIEKPKLIKFETEKDLYENKRIQEKFENEIKYYEIFYIPITKDIKSDISYLEIQGRLYHVNIRKDAEKDKTLKNKIINRNNFIIDYRKYNSNLKQELIKQSELVYKQNQEKEKKQKEEKKRLAIEKRKETIRKKKLNK